MELIYKPFHELTPKQVEDMFRLRQQIFIIEQNCFYEDIDGEDNRAGHLFIYDGEILAAYLRLFEPGIKFNKEASIGRIVVAPEYRGSGLGPKLIKAGIKYCEGNNVRIEAQAALKKYYQDLGFKAEGEIYVVDGIDHLQMTLNQL